MELNVPDDPKEILKQIWKINGLEDFPRRELIYYISLKSNMPYSPSNFNNIIKQGLKKGYIKQKEGKLTLSDDLMEELVKESEKIHENFRMLFPKQALWYRIEESIDPWKFVPKQLKEAQKIPKNYVSLLKSVFSDDEMKRGRRVDRGKIHFEETDSNSQILKAAVDGSHGETYKIVVDVKNKKIIHDCDDFIRNRISNREFCKHFFNTMFGLRLENPKLGVQILEALKKNRNEWSFSEK